MTAEFSWVGVCFGFLRPVSFDCPVVFSNVYSVKVDTCPTIKSDGGVNKGNNKITELRTILQRESQNS